MYLYAKHTGDAARKVASSEAPFGMGLPHFSEVETVEVWATSMTDPGEDGVEFRAFDKAGKQTSVKSFKGY
jgi:hypothetical protein